MFFLLIEGGHGVRGRSTGSESAVCSEAGWLCPQTSVTEQRAHLMVMGSYYPENIRRKWHVHVYKDKRIEFNIIFGVLEGYPAKRDIR